MRKPDEIALAREMLKYGAYGNANVDGFVFERLGIPEKRACYIYKKWAARNWAEYGTSLRLAWLTPEGVEAWTTILSTCDAPKDYCIVTDDIGSYCPYVQHDNRGVYVFIGGGPAIRECAFWILE